MNRRAASRKVLSLRYQIARDQAGARFFSFGQVADATFLYWWDHLAAAAAKLGLWR